LSLNVASYITIWARGQGIVTPFDFMGYRLSSVLKIQGCMLLIETESRTWYLKAESSELAADWLTALKLHT